MRWIVLQLLLLPIPAYAIGGSEFSNPVLSTLLGVAFAIGIVVQFLEEPLPALVLWGGFYGTFMVWILVTFKFGPLWGFGTAICCGYAVTKTLEHLERRDNSEKDSE